MKWLSDENFRNTIIRGIRRRSPAFDIVRARDIPEVRGENDETLLAYATREGRV